MFLVSAPEGRSAAPYPRRAVAQTPYIKYATAAVDVWSVSPDAALLPSGQWATVWSDNLEGPFETLLSIFAPDGSVLHDQLYVNEELSEGADVLDGPRVAVDGQGDFVIVWVDNGDMQENQIHPDLWMTQFSREGAKRFIERRVFVPFTNEDNPNDPMGVRVPRVAAGDRGTSCVVWSDSRSKNSQGARFFDIYGRRFNNAGEPVDSAEFRLNTFYDSGAHTPDVGAGENGDYLVVWTDGRVRIGGEEGPSRSDIFCRLVPGDYVRPGDINTPIPEPTPPTDEIPVSTDIVGGVAGGGEGHARWPAVAGGDGRYLVAWQNDNSSDGTTDIRASLRDASGAKLVGEFQVDGGFPNTNQNQPDVTHLGQGLFLITWVDSDFGVSVMGRVYDARSNTLVSNEVFLDVETGPFTEQSAGAAGGPRFYATWSVNVDPYYGLYARGYDAAQLGDVDGNGRTDARDVLHFSRDWESAATFGRTAAADLDDSGRVDAHDALLLQQVLTEGAPAGRPVEPIVESAAFDARAAQVPNALESR